MASRACLAQFASMKAYRDQVPTSCGLPSHPAFSRQTPCASRRPLQLRLCEATGRVPFARSISSEVASAPHHFALKTRCTRFLQMLGNGACSHALLLSPPRLGRSVPKRLRRRHSHTDFEVVARFDLHVTSLIMVQTAHLLQKGLVSVPVLA